MRGARAAFVAVAAGLGLLCAPGIAAADPVFDQADAQDLADTLADATKAQGVCYGWNITVDDQDTYAGGDSIGSNFGAGRGVESGGTQCSRTVVFRATITYTSSSSESDDSASWSVDSAPSGPSTQDLDDLDLFDEDDLTGDDPDIAVDKAVNALPQLTADAGAAKPIQATEETQVAPDAGNLTDSPGNDFLRAEGGTLLFGAALLIGGVAFAIYVLRNAKQRPQHGLRSTPGEPPVGVWQQDLRRQQATAHPPPRAEDRQGGPPATPQATAASTPQQPPRTEPPTEPLRTQRATGSGSAQPDQPGQPERTEKIDPPARATDADAEPTRRVDPPSTPSTSDTAPERTEKLDPGNPPGGAGA